MKNFTSLIEAWPSPEDFSADLGVSVNTVLSWKQRNNINGRYDCDIVDSAKSRSIKGITYQLLAYLRAGREAELATREGAE